MQPLHIRWPPPVHGLLVPHILPQRHLVDHAQLWLNTALGEIRSRYSCSG